MILPRPSGENESEQVTCPRCGTTQERPQLRLGERSRRDHLVVPTCFHCGEDLAPPSGVSGVATRAAGSAADRRPAEEFRPGAAPASGTGASSAAAAEAGEERPEGGADAPGEDPHETVAGGDTVGDRDRLRPDWEDEAAVVWREGSVVADRYRITRFVGQGGMGKVYLAQDEILRRPMALKRIPQEILFDVDARDDLRQEANRLLDLGHKNIVRVHTYYDGPTWPFFAMEYLRGPTLKKLLRERKRQGSDLFSPEEIRVVARQVGEGLVHAHEHNIVHRDLKPGNLMLADPVDGDLTDDGALIKITDFGVSRVVADSTLRQTGKRSGTLPYMSPEQYRGEPSTVQSDIYSFACTLYELFMGRPPFYTGDVGYQILNISPKPVIDARVPKPMAATILRGMAKDPQDRFDSVRQFVDSLEGKVHVPSRRFTRGVLSVGTKMLVGIAFVLLVVFAASKVFKDQRATTARESGAGGPREKTAGRDYPGVGKTEELERFKEWLRVELQKQLPATLARPEGVTYLGNPPTRSLSLVFREGSAAAPAGYLDKLVFQYHLNDRSENLSLVEGVWQDDSWVYQFDELEEGYHTLEAHLLDRGAVSVRAEPLLDEGRVFNVDLTPAEFTIEAIDERQFVDPAEFSTFDQHVDVALVSTSGIDDIARAYYRRLSDGVEGVPIPIDDPNHWQLELAPPGKENWLYVYAEDAAGNRSERVELTIKRHRLEVQFFEVVDITGLQATVHGILDFEGYEPPGLKFFINGEPAEASWTAWREKPVVGSADGASSGAPGVLPFEAQLAVNQAFNTVELKYVWKDAPPRPFASPVTIQNVMVRRPSVILEDPPSSTIDEQVTLHGSVEPYFEGLVLELDTMGVGTKRVNLTVVGERATFSENVRLLRDRVNHIRFECNFAGSLLIEPPPPKPLEIYCDGKPPECTGVYIEEETSEGLSLEVQVSEPLSSLSARLLVGEVAQGEFHDLALQSVGEVRRPVSYFVRVPFLYRELSKLQFRMTDLAGRTSIMKLPLYRQFERLIAGVVQDDPAEGKTTARTEEPRPQTAVGIIPRSAFLKEMGLIFVPFGDDRLQREMSRTELPDRVWQLFLRTERGLDPEKDERSTAGDPLMPMVLGDQPVTVVRDFVKWFQERANDGYVYVVPTVEQWLCAFTDSDEEQEARQALEKWFDRRFDARPEPRYGVNKPYAMGLRLENMTRTGMLDMESNLQELVVLQDDRTIYGVLGAHNQLVDVESIKRACLHPRKFDRAQQALLKKLTGLRLCRRPRRVRP